MASHVYIHRTCAQGTCRAHFPELIAGTDPAGYEVAVAVLSVSGDRFIVGNSRVRLGNFHAVPASELAFELSVFEIAKLLMQYREGAYEGETPAEIDSWRRRIESWRDYR